jgi:glutathionylspermidine synthase
MAEIRRCMELRHCKWDAQVGDVAVLSKTPLLLGTASWNELSELAQRLFTETLAAESELLARPSLYARIGLPRRLASLFAAGRPTPSAARVMRFDFHFTREGWKISEVNSDVPGGYTEATSFSRLVARQVPGARAAGDPTQALVEALVRRVGEGGTVALTSAPGHMEDHQVVAYLASSLRRAGLRAEVVSVQRLRWRHGHARLEGASGPALHVDAIVRFYQVEWLARLAKNADWTHLFVDGHTRVTNPGTAALTESKRFPLAWDELRTALPTWRQLLPETRALGDAPWQTDERWLLKSAYCNTGDTVSVRSAMTRASWWRRVVAARLQPSAWLAQRRFSVAPVHDSLGPQFPCIGVYVVDGVTAGAYARLTRGAVIDFSAQDAALLIYDGT